MASESDTFTSALASLPDPYRQLLALHEFHGLNARGIGLALGVTHAQARVGLLHARLAMRRRLADRIQGGTG